MLVAALAFGCSAFAEDYSLYFDSTNGTKSTEISPVSKLRKLTFESGKLVATYKDGTKKSTPLADIQRLFFAAPSASGVEQVKDIDAVNKAESVYDLTGRKVSSKEGRELSKGLYIVDGKKVLIK